MDTVTWQDSTYKSNNARWGLALSMGHLEYHAEWELSGTELQITLTGGDSQVAFGAEYKDLHIKSATF